MDNGIIMNLHLSGQEMDHKQNVVNVCLWIQCIYIPSPHTGKINTFFIINSVEVLCKPGMLSILITMWYTNHLFAHAYRSIFCGLTSEATSRSQLQLLTVNLRH